MSRGIRVLSLTVVVAVIGAGAALVAACGSSLSSPPSSTPSTSPTTVKMYKVGITQIVTHPALDAAVKGFKETLAAHGLNVKYDMQNAEGDMSAAAAIAQKFASENLNLIFSVATPTSQAVAKDTSTIPIVFCAVTDPVGAGLVKNLKAPTANVTGVSDMQPVAPILDLVKLVPNATTVGAIYNAGESNSVFLIKNEQAAATKMGYKFIGATASNSSEVQTAAQSLVGRVQAITVIGDNTAVSALDSIVKVCEQNHILLLAGDTSSVQGGAAAGFGFNYEDLGRQAGEQAYKILTGMPVSNIPVEFAKKLMLAVNVKAAKAMGVKLPAALVNRAALKY